MRRFKRGKRVVSARMEYGNQIRDSRGGYL